MIEISAKLSGSAVYFTNDTIKCMVTLKNVATNHNNCSNSRANSCDSSSTLGWCGVQIHCYCICDETKVAINDTNDQQTAIASTDTSFNPCLMKGEKARVIFSSKPKILFCDLKLAANESRSFVYEERIPCDVPPSYSGSRVKYQYKLSIGTQRVNSTIQLLRIPIRILSIINTTLINSNHLESYDSSYSSTPEVVTTATNPLFDSESNSSVLDLSLHKLDCLTAKRCPSSYLITNQFGKVVKFCLLKSTYKLGEDIIGIFNFTEATVPCVQFSVTLQSEEVIAEEYRVKQGKTSFTHITSYGKYHEFCLHMRYTQMIISVPLTVTPSFNSNIVDLSWKLHLEFVTTKKDDIKTSTIEDAHGITEQCPTVLNVQTMVWDLPIFIFPTHPIQVARGFQIPANSTLTV